MTGPIRRHLMLVAAPHSPAAVDAPPGTPAVLGTAPGGPVAAVTPVTTGWPDSDERVTVLHGGHMVWTVPDSDVRHIERLADVVADLLAELGDTEQRIADTLTAAGVRGWPGDADMDPVCRWLTGRDPRLQVWISGDVVHAEGAVGLHHEIAVVPLPAAVVAFRDACADGRHGGLWLASRAPEDDDFVDGPAGWRSLTGSGEAPSAGLRNPPAGPGPAAAAAPDRTPLAAARGAAVSGGGRGLAHAAYGDAVAYALDLRGVAISAYWPTPAQPGMGRSLTVLLDDQVCQARWPAHTQVVLHWAEQHGWRLQPMRGRDIDSRQVLGWYDHPARGPAVLPDPDRLAAWVVAILTGHVTPAAIHGITVTTPIPAVAADAGLEQALDDYRAHAGHHLARHIRGAAEQAATSSGPSPRHTPAPVPDGSGVRRGTGPSDTQPYAGGADA